VTVLTLLGGCCGALFAAGLALIWARLPMRRQPGLAERLEPYLRDAAPPSGLLRSTTPRGQIGWLRPLVARLARVLESVLGGAASVARRQARAGRPVDVSAFRAEQVTWGAAGAAAGAALGALAWLRNPGSPVVPVLAVLLGAMAGVLLRDHALSRVVARREARMVAEFPTIAELLALSVSAGEGTAAAVERVCRLSSGELSHELRLCLADARAGGSLPVALQGLAARTGLPGLIRFVDGIGIALERGTPLAEVLRAQAQDAREEGRRAVLEAAGRKDIHMMIPVVFLVLPVTVLFAVYPGFVSLRLSP